MLEIATQLMEVLFYDSDQPDLHYTAWRLQRGSQYTGIMKVRIRRGDSPYETSYCYDNRVYKTREEVDAAFAIKGVIKRKGRRPL